MLLGHQTENNITNMYKILQSGYLKAGIKTNTCRLYGFGSKNPSKYIYLMNYDITGGIPHLELDSNLLLENISYLNEYWLGKPSNMSIKINGQKTNKKQLEYLLNKYIKKVKTNIMLQHEILLEKDIDLTKYLRKITLFSNVKTTKTYDKLVKLMNKKYPNVKISFLY